MKRSHRLELEKLPGFTNESETLKLRIKAAEQIGRDYDAIEHLAYPPSTQADLLGKVAENQNQMLEKLMPMVEGILNDPKDPRSKMIQQMLDTLGGLPQMHDVEAIRSDPALSGSVEQSPNRENCIEVDVNEELEPPTDAAVWLSSNFERLIPGFVEAAKYAYAQLIESPLSETEAAAYIVDNPTDQDYLNRVRIIAVEISPDRRYLFSLETPCLHLEEHGMCAVFQEDKLVACGEYDVIAEGDDGSDDDDF